MSGTDREREREKEKEKEKERVGCMQSMVRGKIAPTMVGWLGPGRRFLYK
jgi:hypothetical protein